jgi:hypothetical protein
MDFYLEKNYGPPYYRIKKSFKSTDGGSHGLLDKVLGKAHWYIFIHKKNKYM